MSRTSGLPDLFRPAARGTEPGEGPAPAGERQQLAQLAAEFESMLVLQMIKTMRQSMLDEESQGEGLGNDTFTGTIDNELARHLTGDGGLGLQQSMLEAWDRQRGSAASSPAPAGAIGDALGLARAGLSPVVARTATASVARPAETTLRPDAIDRADDHGPDDSAFALEIDGRVSSAYGWRRDPLHGRTRFHGGIDLAASYGTEVPAAAGGTVVSAREQGGYGLTVVVSHGDGYQTRYAHLSSIDVREGDAVGKGTLVGRVGSTGRSTAPHLHFEVLQGGRRIDPDRFVKNLASDIKGQ